MCTIKKGVASYFSLNSTKLVEPVSRRGQPDSRCQVLCARRRKGGERWMKKMKAERKEEREKRRNQQNWFGGD